MSKPKNIDKKVAVSPSRPMICSTARNQHEPLSADEWAEKWTKHLDACGKCRRGNIEYCKTGKNIYFQAVAPEH